MSCPGLQVFPVDDLGSTGSLYREIRFGTKPNHDDFFSLGLNMQAPVDIRPGDGFDINVAGSLYMSDCCQGANLNFSLGMPNWQIKTLWKPYHSTTSLGETRTHLTAKPLPSDLNHILADEVYNVTTSGYVVVDNTWGVAFTLTADYVLDPLPPLDPNASHATNLASDRCNWGNGDENCFHVTPDSTLPIRIAPVDKLGYVYRSHVVELVSERRCGAAMSSPIQATLADTPTLITVSETRPGLYTYHVIVDGQVLSDVVTARWYGDPDNTQSKLVANKLTAIAYTTDTIHMTVYARDACGQVPFDPGGNRPQVKMYQSGPLYYPYYGNTINDTGASSVDMVFWQPGMYNLSADILTRVYISGQWQIFTATVGNTLLANALLSGQKLIAGQVTDQRGQPVQGAWLTARRTTGEFAVVTSGTDGFYKITAPSTGTYDVSAGDPEKHRYTFAPVSQRVTVDTRGVTGVDFVGDDGMPPTYTISGKVFDMRGAGLTGVIVRTDGGASITTGADGRYALTSQARNVNVYAWQTGHKFAPDVIAVSVPPDTANVNFSEITGTTPSLVAYPNLLSADGTAASTVKLSGAQAGRLVVLRSSRGNVDHFTPPEGYVNASGMFISQLRSSTVGLALLSAEDATTGDAFAVSARVTFSLTVVPTSTQTITDTDTARPAIVNIKSTYPLDGVYLQGLSVLNQIDVTVDWGQGAPGSLVFAINGQGRSVPAMESLTSYKLDMGRDSQTGANSLTIAAYDQKGNSSGSAIHAFYVMPIPTWLGILPIHMLSGPSNIGLAYSAGFRFPAEAPLAVRSDTALPVSPKLDWSFQGQVQLPILDCSQPVQGVLKGTLNYKYSDNVGIGGEGGVGLRANRYKQYGPLGACEMQPLEGFAFGKVEGSLELFRQPVLIGVAALNPVVGLTIGRMAQSTRLSWLIDRLGVIVINGRASANPVLKIKCPPLDQSCHTEDLAVAISAGVEGSYNAELYGMFQFKLYAAADGSIKFMRPGPMTWLPTDNWGFDSISLKGEVGYNFFILGFQEEGKASITWVYPQPSQISLATLTVPGSVTSSGLHLVPHGAGPQVAVARFASATNTPQAFTQLGATARLVPTNPVTSILVSNVYTYSEPALAINPADDALLVWVCDDLAKPVGQSQELYYSAWDGSTWSTPTPLTSDNLIDGRPNVAFTSSGEGVAVWQRLTTVQPISATWTVTTARQVQIATATFNPLSLTWSPVSLLTSNAALHGPPVLARSPDGHLLAVWSENASGQLIGDENVPDSLVSAFYDGGWGTPAVITSSIPGLVDYSTGYGAGEATIAYAQPFTPSGSVTPSLQVFTMRWNGTTWSAHFRQTTGATDNLHPRVVYNTANQPLLVWLAGNTLRLRNLGTGAEADLPLPEEMGKIDRFDVSSDGAGNVSATFTDPATGRGLYVAFYDSVMGMWGLSQPLVRDGGDVQYPTTGLDSTGRLLAAYASTVVTAITVTNIISGEVVTYTVPSYGRTDLLTLAKVFTRDLTLTDGDISVSPLMGGGVLVSATAHNSGDLALPRLRTVFYDGDPANRSAFAMVEITTAIPAGSAVVLTATYQPDAAPGARTFTVIADPHGEVAPGAAHNTGRILLTPDEQLDEFGVWADFVATNTLSLHAVVSNTGALPAPTATLAFRSGSMSGMLLVTSTVPPLGLGQSAQVDALWQTPDPVTHFYTLTAIVNEADFSETHRINNQVTLRAEAMPDLLINPYELRQKPLTQTLLMTATVYNAGLVSAKNVVVAFYRSPAVGQATLAFSRSVSILEPGASAVLSGTLPIEGTCDLFVQADPDQSIADITRANNAAGLTLCGPLRHRLFLPVMVK